MDLGTLIILWIVAILLSALTIASFIYFPFGRLSLILAIITGFMWFIIGIERLIDYLMDNPDYFVIGLLIIGGLVWLLPPKQSKPTKKTN
jgi:glucose-6-phosphate-specific signal transduction histidine kinase